MPGLLSDLFSGLIFVTVALTALGVGLVTSSEMARSALRNRRFLAVLLLNVLIIPVAGYLMAKAMPLDSAAETGVIICAICAGGPLALKASQISRSDVTWSLSLTVILLVLNVVTLPLWSAALLERSVAVPAGDLVGILGLSILLPVVLGGLLRRRLRDVEGWSRWVTLTSNVTLVLAVVVGLVGNAGDLVAAASVWPLVTVIGIVVVAGLAARGIPEEADRQRASILGSLNRATSVALLTIGQVFPDDPGVFTVAVLFGLVQTVIALGLAVFWILAGTRSPAPAPVTR